MISRSPVAIKVINFTIFSQKGSPQWLVKPMDMLVGPRERFNIQCSGIGYPLPSVSWKKQIGESFKENSII